MPDFNLILERTFSNSAIYGAVLSTCVFIGIGYLIRRNGLITKDMTSRLSRFIFT